VERHLIELLEHSRHTVAFTGAGVSTLSGIPDFRGNQGLYRTQWNGMDVEDVLSTEWFERDPSLFYGWATEFVFTLDAIRPSIVHHVLAKMESKGYLEAIYTQNIDMLHQKAGSRAVWELHGSPLLSTCRGCGKTYQYDYCAPLVRAHQVPTCPQCSGILKPNIVFYGDPLDGVLLDQAYRDMARSDVLLVLGSSLTVQPAASLPMATYYHGGRMVIVNAQSTPLDRHARIKLDDLASTFGQLSEWIEAVPSRK
jgi:NAD-dependent deacetylase